MVATQKIGRHSKNYMLQIPYQFPLQVWFVASSLSDSDSVRIWATATSLLDYVQFSVAYTGNNDDVLRYQNYFYSRLNPKLQILRWSGFFCFGVGFVMKNMTYTGREPGIHHQPVISFPIPHQNSQRLPTKSFLNQTGVLLPEKHFWFLKKFAELPPPTVWCILCRCRLASQISTVR